MHIADVSHYVKERSSLDKEAYKRGNSVYLIDRVIPMLPKELSNGICSLNPNEDRLSLSVFMEIDKNGEIINHNIVEGVIASKARLIYDDVSDFLENGDKEAEKKLLDQTRELKLMEELAQNLYEKRKRREVLTLIFQRLNYIG